MMILRSVSVQRGLSHFASIGAELSPESLQ